MARPIRVEFPGAVYHLVARGNERRKVFRDDQDRQRLLQTVAEMVAQFDVRVHAYCLMANHYHLLVETPRGNLSQAAGWLQLTYTVRFNRRHGRSGHLFQGRFKAQLIEADEYARWLVEYIHWNPVRPRQKGQRITAERALELDHYAWSSHRDYAGLRTRSPDWLCLDWQRYWGRTLREAQVEYRRRIAAAFAAGEMANPWEQLKGGLVLGGQELWQRVQLLVADKPGQQEAVWSHQTDLAAVRRRLSELLANETDEWVKIWAWVILGGEQKAKVARAVGYAGGSSVIYALRRLAEKASHNRATREKLNRLKTEIDRLKS